MEKNFKNYEVPCEVYTRVVGYYRPVQNYNLGKKEEYFDRKEFSEEASLQSKIANTKDIAGKPTIYENGKPDFFYVGVKGCSGCEDIKESIIKRTEIGKYYGFEKPRQALDFVKSLDIPLGKEINFPMKIQIT